MLGAPQDIALLAGIALLLFGPKKLPEIGRALGQGLGNFKKALNETQNEFKEGVTSTEKTPAIEEEKKPVS